MAGVLPDPSKIAQMALELPQSVLNTEMRQMNEKVGVLTTEVQKLAAAVPPLPVLGAGLPTLPGLPELPGMGGAGAAALPQTRSEAVRGVKTTKKASYMET